MKLKTVVIEGKTYAEVSGENPIYVHDSGQEIPHDAAQTVATISRLNGEAKTNRERYETAETSLKAFEGIEDPAAAKKALDTLKNFDDKKLVDAGEVEKVKAEAIKAVEDKYAPVVQERDAFQAQLHGELIGGGFARSTYAKDNLNIPTDMLQAQFGRNFKIENGKVVAYAADGQQIYSKSRPGELADFDEALETMVGEYQHKDLILVGNQSGGGGFGGGAATRGPSIKRSEMNASDKAAYLKEHGQESYLNLPK